MKVRMGYISNSSSSSFIIARAYITDDQFNSLIKKLDELRTNPPEDLEEWGESGQTYEYNKNYIMIETYYSGTYINDILNELKIDKDKAFITYN